MCLTRYLKNIHLPINSCTRNVIMIINYRNLWHYIHDISKTSQFSWLTYTTYLLYIPWRPCKKRPKWSVHFHCLLYRDFHASRGQRTFVFSDAFKGHNRNHTLIRMFLILAISGGFKKSINISPWEDIFSYHVTRKFARNRIDHRIEHMLLIIMTILLTPLHVQVLSRIEWWNPRIIREGKMPDIGTGVLVTKMSY